MGLPSRLDVHARHRDGPDCRNDPRQAAAWKRTWRRGICACLIWLCAACASVSVSADPLRVAFYDTDLSRRGPGLLLRDLLRGSDPQLRAFAEVTAALDADVLVLGGIDFDLEGRTLDALAKVAGDYPYRFALRPNSGWATGLDLNGDGRLGDPGDAQGWGRFAGAGGLAVISRLPVDTAQVREFSGFLWRDLPGALLPPMSDDALAIQRLSSTAHWEVPVTLPDGRPLRLLIWSATPPLFDGPEDRNGKRNHDEAAFWRLLLDGKLPIPAPEGAFVLLGNANIDPADGEGLRDGIAGLLAHPKLQDPAPRNTAARDDPGQTGDPGLDTVLFARAGGLRVDYVLPQAGLRVTGAGVLWPSEAAPLAVALGLASRHRPVWVDLDLP